MIKVVTMRKGSCTSPTGSIVDSKFARMLATIVVSVVLVGCAHNTTTVFVKEKIKGPKIIALDAPRTPWRAQIDIRIRKSGFKVLRWASTRRVREQVSDAHSEEYNKASTRYVLIIDGEALMDAMHRCFGGGFQFNYLNAELIDVQSNETIFIVSGSGFSEGCQPMSGKLYSNIVSALENAWEQ